MSKIQSGAHVGEACYNVNKQARLGLAFIRTEP